MKSSSQSHCMSILEASLNVVTGFLLSLIVQALMYPMFGIVTSFVTDSMISTIFTIASLVRSYLLRWAFVWLGQLMDGSDARPQTETNSSQAY